MRACGIHFGLLVAALAACRPVGETSPGESTTASFVRATGDIEELRAFALLYGYVRYFHPSDEAAAIDWDGFATYGVRRVTEANNRDELGAILEELFLPVAPTLDIYAEGEAPRARTAFFPAETEGLEVVGWQHLGFGFGDMSSAYASKRTHRARSVPVGHQSKVKLTQTIDAEALRGLAIRVRALAKVDSSAPQASVRVHLRVRQPEGRDVLAVSSLHAGLEWGTLETEAVVPGNASTLALGASVAGQGAAWIDDFALEVQRGGAWHSVPIDNPGFESGQQPDPWQSDASNFVLQVRDESHGGAQSLWVARKSVEQTEDLFEERLPGGELLRESLGAGLECQLPLSLYSSGDHTLRAPGDSKPPGPPDFSRTPRSADDPAVRIAAVIVAWNVFQHFYPYFDAIDTDWGAVLETSLRAAVQDADATDTLHTLTSMVALLHDGHGAVMPPFAVREQRVPATFAMVQGHVVVLSVVEGDALRRGDIVLKLDGQGIGELLAVGHARLSGSPQWRQHRLLAWSGITKGPAESLARFEIERTGEMMTVDVERRDARAAPAFTHEAIGALEGGSWYIDLSRASWEQITEKLDSIAAAPGVIFDLRGYPNGNHQILQHLLTAPEHDLWMFTAHILRPDQRQIDGWDKNGWDLKPAEPHISGKVAFITGGGAISYAESVMGYVERLELGEIVGQPTAGANGNINPFTTPGGYLVVSTGMQVRKRDGSFIHRVGVTPTIPAASTLAGILAGRDEPFEHALAAVSEGTADRDP